MRSMDNISVCDIGAWMTHQGASGRLADWQIGIHAKITHAHLILFLL
jgi:hypothetical protein